MQCNNGLLRQLRTCSSTEVKSHTVDRLRYVTKNLMKSKTEIIRTDQGGEYNNRNMVNLCREISAKHEMSAKFNVRFY